MRGGFAHKNSNGTQIHTKNQLSSTMCFNATKQICQIGFEEKKNNNSQATGGIDQYGMCCC